MQLASYLGVAFLLAPQQHGTIMTVRISAVKIQGFRKEGLVDCRREDSPIYYLYRLKSTVLRHLQSQGIGGLYIAVAVLLSMVCCCHTASNTTKVYLTLAVAAPALITSAVCLRISGGSFNGQFTWAWR